MTAPVATEYHAWQAVLDELASPRHRYTVERILAGIAALDAGTMQQIAREANAYRGPAVLFSAGDEVAAFPDCDGMTGTLDLFLNDGADVVTVRNVLRDHGFWVGSAPYQVERLHYTPLRIKRLY
jgi:hypothetical protein